MREKLIDKTGMKFGRLTVMSREGTYQRPSGNKEATWRCKCECGNEVVVLGSNLRKNNTSSCGCLQKENRLNSRRDTEYEIHEDVVYVKSFDGTEFVVNVCDLEYVLAHRWHSNGHGYMTNEHGKTIHRVLMKPPAAMDVHHINGNKLDNRRSNLLMMSRAEHSALHKGVPLANGVTIPVRCKDCVHWYDKEETCLKIYSDGAVSPYAWQFRRPDDFCSYGERKSE